MVSHVFSYHNTGTIEDYKLLEQMNKVTFNKYTEMKNIATAVGNALQDLNDRCELKTSTENVYF